MNASPIKEKEWFIAGFVFVICSVVGTVVVSLTVLVTVTFVFDAMGSGFQPLGLGDGTVMEQAVRLLVILTSWCLVSYFFFRFWVARFIVKKLGSSGSISQSQAQGRARQQQ